jgi:hypothetical protein
MSDPARTLVLLGEPGVLALEADVTDDRERKRTPAF